MGRDGVRREWLEVGNERTMNGLAKRAYRPFRKSTAYLVSPAPRCGARQVAHGAGGEGRGDTHRSCRQTQCRVPVWTVDNPTSYSGVGAGGDRFRLETPALVASVACPSVFFLVLLSAVFMWLRCVLFFARRRLLREKGPSASQARS